MASKRNRRRARKAPRRVTGGEAKFILGFALALAGWLFIGIPFFNHLVSEIGLTPTYGFFMIFYTLTFMALGSTKRIGLEVGLSALVAFLIIDIAVPPMLIPYDNPTVLTPEQSLASDAFVYGVFSHVMPHRPAWIATYFGIPVGMVLLLVVVFSERQSKKLVRRAFA